MSDQVTPGVSVAPEQPVQDVPAKKSGAGKKIIGILAVILIAAVVIGFKFGLRAFLREFFGLPSFAFVDRHRPGLLRDA